MSIAEVAEKMNMPYSSTCNIIQKFLREGRFQRKRKTVRQGSLSMEAIEDIISEKTLLKWQGLTLKERAKEIALKWGV